MRSAFLLLIPIVLAGCQKVISINLNSTEKKYIVSGRITDQPGECQVSITRTKDFSENNQFPGVSGAAVTVEDQGVITTLQESGSGLYICDTLTGRPGHTYLLTIRLGGETFSSASTMPQPVNLDSMYVSTAPLSKTRYITVTYKDPLNFPNYYHFIQYINGLKEPTIFVSDDEFTDGQKVKSQLQYNNDTDNPARDIKKGDSVSIDMICNDAAVYQFWYSLSSGATGANESASPANPVSNISGGAVGYFSAQTIQRKTLLVN
ncbi:DUF4249 domain-containing protein [Flavitalea sp. BT771]|uniref:DUF4249 domain-containing protein n=1 Tax=Flavitalea sp. BT771 TaxID=3063329 RepID=UPI0026E1D413|nr:DUF4249 domain-containing protein [Flavitalea sp. BT771]MDO6430460.1 DUF4249 domain-containing protein [Flavitalea sp. BT771]MDV6219400.1 DUF4249 domain-containing protein [Flavitalea sp. BT771]